MNASTLIKFMIGALPVAPIVDDFIDLDIEETSSQPDEAYKDYNGPTMDEELQSHAGSVPALKGVDNINVRTGSNFDPLDGAYALDSEDGNITDNIEVTNNNVNTESPGTYTVSYRVENSLNGYYEYVRQVTVSSAASDPVPLVPPTKKQLATDSKNSNNNLTNSVVFNGIEDTIVSTGSEFDPKAGVSVIDTDGTDISNTLYISGEVDTKTPGVYTIAYAIFDSFGDPTAVARDITVE